MIIKRFHSNLFFASDLVASAEFYEKLGFTVARADTAFRVKLGDFTLAVMDEHAVTITKAVQTSSRGEGMFLYVEVDDVDALYRHVHENGVISTEPRDWPWGKREFVVRDPDGYQLVFFAPIKK